MVLGETKISVVIGSQKRSKRMEKHSLAPSLFLIQMVKWNR